MENSYPQDNQNKPHLGGLVILEKTREMIIYGVKALEHFPKTERYVLAADIRHRMYAIYEGLITAQKRYHKKTTLQQVDVDLEVLRGLVRLAADTNLRYLPIKKYEHWSRLLDEIGRLLGGWLKWASQEVRAVP